MYRSRAALSALIVGVLVLPACGRNTSISSSPGSPVVGAGGLQWQEKACGQWFYGAEDDRGSNRMVRLAGG